jgi:predicted ATP-dependent Lon-type protease
MLLTRGYRVEKILEEFQNLSLSIFLLRFQSDPLVFSEKLMKMIELVNTLYPELKDKDRILDRIVIKKLPCKIIDEIKVEVDEKHEIRKVKIPSLNLTNVMISDKVVEENEQLLSTGI